MINLSINGEVIGNIYILATPVNEFYTVVNSFTPLKILKKLQKKINNFDCNVAIIDLIEA
ncbi:MAG: hypothetical protein HQK76_11440 [Desulfobacterales bacterium]|nr:hypothetical protein [Desulfobacterales bacterium]